ncbi:conjugal transfer protein TraD [Legionella pneumophila]
MKTFKQIEKGKQLIANCEKSLTLEKLKKRRADTRRKIELGGLVIKSGIDIYSKLIILGALKYVTELINKNHDYVGSFELMGKNLFMENNDKI